MFGSTLLISGLGSVFALEDQPDATNVVRKHLKPEAPEASHRRDGRHGVTHDHATSTTTLGAAVDLSVGAYLEADAPEGSAGTTAKDVSLACLGIAVPDEAGNTWVCRQLNSLVAKNDAVKSTTGICTRDRAAPDRWVWTGAGRRERQLLAEAAERLAREGSAGCEPPDAPGRKGHNRRSESPDSPRRQQTRQPPDRTDERGTST